MAAFGSTDPALVRSRWLKELERSPSPAVGFLGVPYEGGTYGLGGTAAGPLGVRVAWGGEQWCERLSVGLDLGDIPYFPGPPLDEMLATGIARQARAARYGEPDFELPVCMLSVHQRVVRAAAVAGMRMLSIGGDHSIAASALAGIDRPGIGLVHVDSHPDLSTGRDGLGLLHSSWIHHVDQQTRLSVVVQVGVPAIPIPDWIKGRLQRIPGPHLADPIAAARDAADYLAAARVRQAYLSIDIDAVDASEAPATGLPAVHGLAVHDLILFIEALGERTSIIGADLVEVAPPLSGRRTWDDETTCVSGSRLATALIAVLASERANTMG
jgi:arginase family enzyme